jgi:Flp pilus assembly protein TadB
VLVGLMPVVITLAMLVVDPGMMIPFLHSTVGLAVILLVVALIGLGAFFIRRIVNIDV